MHFHPKIKSRYAETQVEWLLLNPVNVSFPVTCHSDPSECPRDRVCNILENSKSLSWFKFNLPTLSQPEPLPGVTALLTMLGTSFWLNSASHPKGFPISTMCVLQCQDPIPFLSNTLGSFLLCCPDIGTNPTLSLFVCCR